MRKWRTTAGWSQEEVARRAGVPLNRVHRLERGITQDPHLSTLRAIASAFGRSVEELVAEEESPSEAVLVGKAEAPALAEELGQMGQSGVMEPEELKAAYIEGLMKRMYAGFLSKEEVNTLILHRYPGHFNEAWESEVGDDEGLASS
jgi:transcriptional regulator with XRE-family HTH domain